jgi:predicted SprT family Zn-dependent metalloprotease
VDLQTADAIANKIVRHYAPDWTVSWGTAKSQFGLCRFKAKNIRLSRPLTLLNSQQTFEWVVRHEVAHILAGAEAGHGRMFKVHALSLGIIGDRCWTQGGNTDVTTIEGKYLGTCKQRCGYTVTMHRVTHAAYHRGICTECSSRRIRMWVHLDWTRDGKPVPEPKKPAPRRRRRRAYR